MICGSKRLLGCNGTSVLWHQRDSDRILIPWPSDLPHCCRTNLTRHRLDLINIKTMVHIKPLIQDWTALPALYFKLPVESNQIDLKSVFGRWGEIGVLGSLERTLDTWLYHSKCFN